VETDVELYGIDASMEMLKRARSRLLANRLLPNLVIADLQSLPFPDRQMDLVMAALVLEHVGRPIDALREIVRVARPGAMILLVTTRPNAPDLPFRLAFGYKPFEKNEVLGWMMQVGIQGNYLCPLSGLAYLFAQAYIGVKAD
jgi:ubiquinone/menaquinone biosynthesis C-methylase UbiE